MSIELCPTCNNIICECPSENTGSCYDDPGNDTPEYPEILDHQTIPSPSTKDPTICEMCRAENPDKWFKHCAMYMCPTCRNKEMALSAKSAAGADKRVADARTDMLELQNQELVDKQKEDIFPLTDLADELPVDGTIRVRSEFFNANITSIIEMKKAIDEDSSIEKKHYALAEQLKERFTRLRKVLFDIDEKRVTITSEQRGIQTYLNDLANKLRTDEREKLKLSDLTYQPVAPKKPRESKTRKPKAPKFDKAELRRLASETGIPEFTLQTICVAKGIQPAEAAKMLKGLQK